MDDAKGAGVRIPPPVVFIFFMFCGLGLGFSYPIAIHFPVALAYTGVALSIFGLMVLLHLATLFKRVKTNIEPWKPTSRIISTGIYAYSRNPIYLAFCTIPLGEACFSAISG
ncbi:methyltransferase family protein [Shewanella psychropiezotolerans]|uniref:methyltransferase family protein n=1 Tax=Shewanella psychropiezotolerans TaxID=2593655 RepID=UPI001E2ADB0E|nr:methyltransferase [Shewanella psychropiezotolerans]